MGNKGKVRRERKAAQEAERRVHVLAQKREQRRRVKQSVPPLGRKEKLRIFLDIVWRVTGGPIVWITQWSPFSKERRSERSGPAP